MHALRLIDGEGHIHHAWLHGAAFWAAAFGEERLATSAEHQGLISMPFRAISCHLFNHISTISDRLGEGFRPKSTAKLALMELLGSRKSVRPHADHQVLRSSAPHRSLEVQ